MDLKRFEDSEDAFQAQYDCIKLPCEPCVVVTLTLLRYRNISAGYIRDMFFTPIPRFRVTCPKLEEQHLRHFVADRDDDKRKGEINETFKFVLPKPVKAEEEFPIIFDLYVLNGYFSDLFIGKQEIDVSTIPLNKEADVKVLRFGRNAGVVEVKFSKELRTTPDFRYSLGLCPKEKTFRKKRIPIVHKAMKKSVGEEGPQTLEETPVVSLVCSGGGYRAVVGMCGVMEALKDADLSDIITYQCTASGSAWYLMSAYSTRTVFSQHQQTVHEALGKELTNNFYLDMINPSTHARFKNFQHSMRKEFLTPQSFANYYPGFLVAKQMVGMKVGENVDEWIPYVETGKVPFPLIVAMHAKDRTRVGSFHAYTEKSPYETYIPSYGVGLDSRSEGSLWSKGFLVRKCPKYPMYCSAAMTGCAFSILFADFLKYGSETSIASWKDKERSEGQIKKGKGTYETSGDLRCASKLKSEESDVEDTDDENDPLDPEVTIVRDKSKDGEHVFRVDETMGQDEVSDCLPTEPPSPKLPLVLLNMIKNTSLLASRTGGFGRTARLFNCVYGFNSVKRYYLNPFGKIPSTRFPLRCLNTTLVCADGLSAGRGIASFKDCSFHS